MAEKKLRESQVDLSRIDSEIDAVNTRIDGLGKVFNYKGRVDSADLLPSSGNKEGDLYLVGLSADPDKAEYFWTGLAWEYLGNTSNQNYATETRSGIIELATAEETKAGTDSKRAVTPATLKQVIDTKADLVNGIVPDNQLPASATSAADKTLSNVSTIDPNSKVQFELNNKADLDLANTGRITNCVTKIPQDIKLELSDGTLTLKAGSKVYVPNGPGVFKEIITSKDITRNVSNENNFLYTTTPNSTLTDIQAVGGANISSCYSGQTQPEIFSYWYDTTNNKIYSESVSDSKLRSLPICVIQNNKLSVFNGFGYIGSVAFILPGVECLLVNGRNTDGSLRSVLTKISKFLIPDHISDISRTEIYIRGTSSSVAVEKGGYIYKEQDNIFYFGTEARNACLAYYIERDSNGKILSLTPKPVFHAADYFDCVSKYGDTMTGALKVPTPATSANDTTVPTTAWVRNYIVGFPNFSAGITIDALDPSTYTAPSNGWVHFVTSGGSDGRNTLNINGTQVYYQANQGSGASACSCFLPVKKGDKIKLTKSGGNPVVETQKFYPSI